jgi:AcrR family transcriptional regulator
MMPGQPADSVVDARVAKSRERVLTSAFEILGRSGIKGFSVDEVARRSGVAKTTIYRHWASREALVLDAASRISAEQDVPDSGSPEDDVIAILANLGHLLGTARWSSVVPSIVDVAERDAEFADLHATIQRGHAAPLRRVLERAVERGVVPATADVSTMVSGLVGPLYYRRWFSREPIDGQFVVTLTRGVFAAAGHQPGCP